MLGIIGGGQLGRMFTQSAQAMGEKVCVLDPADKEKSPAASIANMHICAQYDDIEALVYMAKICSAISIEFENVPASSLEFLATQNILVAPSALAVSIAQNRQKEKQFLQDAQVNIAPYVNINKQADMDYIDPDIFPAILKVSTLGYDGKGQIEVNDISELSSAWLDLGSNNCVLEKKLNINHEISVIICRDKYTNTAMYPIGQNIHKDGILVNSIVPSPITSQDTANRAYEYAGHIAKKLNYIGVLCIEFFVLDSGDLCVNEIAPRPHNSGHYTQNACITSQFEQQVRILADLPLGSTLQHTPVVMLNIMGDAWLHKDNNNKDFIIEPNWSQILQNQGTQLHLYGKDVPKKARKMGHINCLGTTLKHAQQIAVDLAGYLD
jgi:5-(carboxyamino)imidazole ribonucleotide synthase